MIFENIKNGPKSSGNFLFLIIIIIFNPLPSAETVNEPRESRDPWNQNRELTPCQASALVREVRAGFGKVIPQFNPDTLGIYFKTDGGLTFKPTDPGFCQFLLLYYSVTSKTIGEMERDNARGRNAMLLTFNSNYLTFLNNYGVPLSCISFYAGKSSSLGVTGVQDLATKLQSTSTRQSGAGQGQGPALPKHFGLLAQEMIGKLGLTGSPFIPYPTVEPGSYSPACDRLFLKLQDGSTVTTLPSVTVPPDTIRIPGQGAPIRTDLVNVTFLLTQYLSTGINCLGSFSLRANFSSSVLTWMEMKLLPPLLGSSNCFNGFPGILNLLNSVKLYSEAHFERISDEENANVMSWAAKYEEVKRDDPQQQQQFGPSPEFKNLYYPEVPEEDPGWEYAPLQEQQPQVIQNEVYPISPKFKPKVAEETGSVEKHDQMTGPLMAGVSVTAILLVVLICCGIPLWCFYCLKPKAFKRRHQKVKTWFRDHFQDTPSNSSVENEPFLKRKKKRCPLKTKVNIKVNEVPYAEVSITEPEDDSSDEVGDDDHCVQRDYCSDFHFEIPGSRKERGNVRGHLGQRTAPKPPEDHVVAAMETRKDRRASYPVESEGQSEHIRMKRHSFPRPTPSDFRPPPAPVHSYENRKPSVLVPVTPDKSGGSFEFFETSTDDERGDIEKGRKVDKLLVPVNTEEEFYRTKMAGWGTEDKT